MYKGNAVWAIEEPLSAARLGDKIALIRRPVAAATTPL